MHKREYSSDESPTETIVSSVATMKGCDETEVASLYETIDPDALNQVIREGVRVRFEYEGYEIEVDTDGVRLEKREGSALRSLTPVVE